MKKLFAIVITYILCLNCFSAKAEAAPSTKGRLGLGGESFSLITSGTGTSLFPYASLRLGVTNNFKLEGLFNFNFADSKILFGFGLMGLISIDQSKNVQPYIGLGALVNAVPPNATMIGALPLFGVEYFLTNDLTFDAAIGFPVSMMIVKDAGFKFGGISTSVSPILGFHYYF